MHKGPTLALIDFPLCSPFNFQDGFLNLLRQVELFEPALVVVIELEDFFARLELLEEVRKLPEGFPHHGHELLDHYLVLPDLPLDAPDG